MRRSVILLALAAAPGSPLAQDSAAARWLAQEALETYCQGGGSFGPDGLVERDLTGDGRADLLIYTGGLACDSGRPACGAVYCDANFYVREGDLLVDKGGVLTQCAEVGAGDPPEITLCQRDDGPYVVRWTGAAFE